jgi:hypothetical protein
MRRARLGPAGGSSGVEVEAEAAGVIVKREVDRAVKSLS